MWKIILIAYYFTPKLPENLIPEKTYIFNAYDYENTKEILALSGYTTDNEVIWGKLISRDN